MKYQKLTKERTDLIEKQSMGAIQFKIFDGTIKGVCFPSPIGKIFVEIDSYSVSFNELAKETVFYLSFFATIADDKIFIEKSFSSERDREIYILTHLSETPADELTLEERVVESN